MLYGIALIVLGILAAPSILLSRKPNAKELLGKITPYQGWIGLIFCILGIIGIISSLMHIGWLTSYPIWWITWIVGAALETLLGFILGYGMISKFVLSKNEAAKKKGEELLAKLAPVQGKLGVIAIIVGIWTIIASIVFF